MLIKHSKPTFLIFLFVALVLVISCQDEPVPDVEAKFSAEETTILQGESVEFIDLSCNEPGSWQWSFEGGSPIESEEQNPIVTYPESGTYTVTLRVSNDDSSDEEVKTTFINVLAEISPVIGLEDSVFDQNSSVIFMDNSEGDPNRRVWQFEGGEPATSTAENPEVTYSEAGIYTVTLFSSNDLSSSLSTRKVYVLPTEGLILHLPLNGSAEDLSVNSNDGTIIGATATVNRRGSMNQAMSFDGTDDEIIFPFDDSYLDLEGSFSFWAKFNEFNSAILGNDIQDGIQSGSWFSVGQSSDTFGLLAFNYGNGGSPRESSRRSIVSEEPLELDTWYHIVGTRDSRGNMKLFLNGAMISIFKTGTGSTYFHSQSDGSLGRVWDPNSFFSGTMDDIRFYDRELTEEEVEVLTFE